MSNSQIVEKTSLTKLINLSNRQFIDSEKHEQKIIGQFFTPPAIALFMAKQFSYNKKHISILDPGSGTGILTAAICDRILTLGDKKNIDVHFYENDSFVLPILNKNATDLKTEMESFGHIFQYKIFSEDFVSKNSKYINGDSLFSDTSNKPEYDIIISNPPYYKLKKSDILSRKMKDIVHGQPNIYSFFMAISACLLRKDGELVFITPRSFCSGAYFKMFRKWFLNQVKPVFIHSFESRKEIFENGVLQETIILKATKTKNEPSKLVISSSNNSDFEQSKILVQGYSTLINCHDSESIIHIPTNNQDIKILEMVRSWKKTFTDYGFRISTGPIVSFRASKFLKKEVSIENSSLVPLFWMNHLKNFTIEYPKKELDKPQSVVVNDDSFKILLKNRNYVFVKRFSSKEQKKRVYASFYDKDTFNTNYIGVENHLNYIWKPTGELSTTESLGIMAILNSTIIDKFFRIINGNTQVNASEINNLPFPAYDEIISIGKEIKTQNNFNLDIIDSVVTEKLSIPYEIWGHYN